MIINSVRSIKYIVPVCILGIFFCQCLPQEHQECSDPRQVTILFSAPTLNCKEQLEEFVPEPFFLERLTFESDVYMQPSEFFYLMDIHEGSWVDAAVFERGISYIRRKNKFESIQLIWSSGVEGECLHVKLTGFWSFHKLKISGILVGRDAYRRYYQIEQGESFDDQQHQESLSKVKDAFRQDGFFNGVVEDTLSYDNQTKSVSTKLFLSKGNRFVIGSVGLQIHGFPSLKDDELDFVRTKLEKQFLHNLSRKGYSRSMLNEETKQMKHYLLRHGFLHVSIALEESIDYQKEIVDLMFNITLHHKREFVFFGNNFFSSNQLLDTIMVFEHSVWLLPLPILAEEIIKAYHDKGFWNVCVESREEDDRAFFVIKEGERAVITDIVLEGVEHMDKKQLIRSCFRHLLRVSYFDEDLLKQALGRLTTSYIKDGFWNVAIVQKKFELIDNKKNHCRIIIAVDEGKRHYLTDVMIPQFPELTKKGPFKLFGKNNQKIPFDMSILHAQKKWLGQYCKGKGMADAEISYDLAHDGNDLSVTWNIKPQHEGIRFGKTVIVGSSAFPFDYVLRELQYQEGHQWDRKNLNQTLSRLKELEVFEMVHAYPDRDMQDDNCQPVMLKLHKDDPFEVRLRGGVGLEQVSKPITLAGVTYKAGGTFIIKNPFNCGDIFCLNADGSRSIRSIFAEYKRPWIFDMPFRSVIRVYSSKYQQPGFFYCKKGLYEVSQNGMLFSLGRYYRGFDTNVTLGLEWMKLSIQDEFKNIAGRVSKAIDFDHWLLDKNIPFLYIQPTVFLDRLDNKLNPIKGSLTVVSCKGMLPLTEYAKRASLLKLLVEQSFFYPFMPLVFALRIRFGHIFYQEFNDINPIERFYLGGANSLRSYDTDVAPPLGCFEDTMCKSRCAPMGGKTMVNANLEVRFPIYGDLGGVLFQDFGQLSHKGIWGLGKDGLLAGTGVGIRYNTPIGPLRFDIAWKWSVCKPLERSYAWFLTFGNAF